jgi:hypothetical protein
MDHPNKGMGASQVPIGLAGIGNPARSAAAGGRSKRAALAHGRAGLRAC